MQDVSKIPGLSHHYTVVDLLESKRTKPVYFTIDNCDICYKLFPNNTCIEVAFCSFNVSTSIAFIEKIEHLIGRISTISKQTFDDYFDVALKRLKK